MFSLFFHLYVQFTLPKTTPTLTICLLVSSADNRCKTAWAYGSAAPQWLSGRVLVLRRGFAGLSLTGVTVVSLSKTKSLLSTGSSQEDPSRHN